MMRLARRASLLRSEVRMLGSACAVAFSRLASAVAVTALAATVYAECPWVLWSGTTATKSGIDEALEAFESQAKCEAARQKYGRRDEAERDAFGTAPTREERRRGDGTYSIYRCFPDTVDPRGRGK